MPLGSGRCWIIFTLVSLRANSLPAEKVEGATIGIDLGTSYSSVGIYHDGEIQIIPNDNGNHLTPSSVAFTADGEILIGDLAVNQLTMNPENTIIQPTRFIGRKWDESVEEDIRLLPSEVINRNGKPHFRVNTPTGHKVLSPEEITAMILRKMKEIAEKHLEQSVSYAVVTVPALFSEAQRQATKDACIVAGLTVKRLIIASTAAALPLNFDTKKDEKNVLVFDLGGGSLSVSLMVIDHDVVEVVTTSGNIHLGGEDFNYRVMSYYIKHYWVKHRIEIRDDKYSVQKLRRETERAKRVLSTTLQVKMEIELFNSSINFTETLTRAKFEELNMDLFKLAMNPLQRVMKDWNQSQKNIDDIVLVGGSTQIPMIRQLVKRFFNERETFYEINPHDTIAYGVASLGHIPPGNVNPVVVLDIYPCNLGIEIGQLMETVVSRNTPIPFSKSRLVTTAIDNKESVFIKVLEGERAMAKDNTLLGQCTMTRIRKAPKGIHEIIVTFDMNVNGILQVSAKNERSSLQDKVIISCHQGFMNVDDMVSMTNHIDEFYNIDKTFKERLRFRNELESSVYSLQKQFDEDKSMGINFTGEILENIKRAVDDQIVWLERNEGATAEDLKWQLKELESIMILLYGPNDEPNETMKILMIIIVLVATYMALR